MRRHDRHGFTLVELLVVIAIIGVLVAMILPAVQAAREASRRAACKSNLKQVSLALQTYHDSFKTFPPAHIWYGAPPNQFSYTPAAAGQQGAAYPQLYGPNWILMLLPFLEQQNVHALWNPHRPISDATNQSLRSYHIEVLTCPSDPYATPGNLLSRYGGSWARTSYGANVGRTDPLQIDLAAEALQKRSWSAVPGHVRGAMHHMKGARDSDVLDGLSNSIAVWEIRSGPDANDPRGAWALYRGTMVAGCDNNQDCNGINDQTGPPDDVQDCVDRPNVKMPCWNGGDGQHGPKSLHPGGCHATLLDGSVRFVSETIDTDTVMRAMNSIQGREVFEMP